MKYFMLIIDGEVVGEFMSNVLHKEKERSQSAEKLYAILSSNPIIITADKLIPDGSIWDGKKFLPPVE